MRKLLIVAYHFPPVGGSSGFLRSLKFCRYLPQNGWLPVVLTVHPRAYERIDPSQLSEIPQEVAVRRAFALDTRKHLSIAGRYPLWLALPDRYLTWVLGAIPSGVFEIYRSKVDVIFSTFPIASAVLIGWLLRLFTGKPWVVDFRDPLTEDDYPPDPRTHRVYRWLESKVVRHASLLVFTADSTKTAYLRRYTQLNPEKCVVIPNGYDERDFQGLTPALSASNNGHQPITLLHIGLLYPQERDPRPFFHAISRLKQDGFASPASLRINLRASGNETEYSKMLKESRIDDIVHLLPPVPYQQALQEGADADGLLLFQAANCNNQIPAKGYEYLRLGKPILALTDEAGDTAALMKECGGATIVNLADQEAIYRALPAFLTSLRSGSHLAPNPHKVAQYSRESQTRALAESLNRLVASRTSLS
jgi:glycosyltransferase involved in cell wall biosynthesis